MAKQSARSKGYRKTAKKKPFLTKKEIIELLVIVAVIVVGVVLFNLFYDDGYLRAGDVKQGDVVSYVSRDVDNRYVKVAELRDLEGFSCDEPDLSVNPRAIYTLTPDAETDHIDSLSLSGSFIAASNQIETTRNQMSALGDQAPTFTEVETTTIQGHDAYVYSYTYDYYEAPEDESGEAGAAEEAEAAGEAGGEDAGQPASNTFTQTLGCYVDVDGYTLCFHIYRSGDDASIYVPEDQVLDYLTPYTACFQIYEKEAK